MLKTTSGFLTILLLILPRSASASVNVQVSGNGDGSNSTVSVESNTSSPTSKNTYNNSTDIRIETNGEVKEYHGTGDQNITVQSGNGGNSVSVNTKGSSNPSSSPSASSSAQPSPTSSASPTSTAESKVQTLMEMIKKEIQSFLNLFKF